MSPPLLFSPNYLNARARKSARVLHIRGYKRGRQRDAFWQALTPQSKAIIPASRKHDILDKGSLTQRLIHKSGGNFRVEVVAQGLQRPEFSEWRRLQLKERQVALVRSVKLLGNDQVWVLARSIIPLSSLKGKTKYLASLGNKPLGAVLFRDPSLERALFELSALEINQLANFLPLPEGASFIGRRSVFYLRNKPLLVEEVFLDSCPDLSV